MHPFDVYRTAHRMESVLSRKHDLHRYIVITAKKQRVNKGETEHAHADIALEAESAANESDEPE